MKQFLGHSTSEFEVSSTSVSQERCRLKMIPFPVSRFSFGTAKLHHVSERLQNRLLCKAVDVGMTHFDTSPYYGYGAAERALRRSFMRNTDVTVATKVGIYPPKFREYRNSAMKLRKLLGKVNPSLNKKEVDFSIARMSASLSGSLQRLGRDQIDILFLHEPTIKLMQTDEVLRFLENSMLEGKVREFGVSGFMADLIEVHEDLPSLCRVMQTDYQGYCNSQCIGLEPQFLFGVFPYVLKQPGILETLKDNSILYTTTSEYHMDIFS